MILIGEGIDRMALIFVFLDYHQYKNVSNECFFNQRTIICHQVRVTNLDDASEHIGEVLRRVKKEHLQRAYKIQEWYVFS